MKNIAIAYDNGEIFCCFEKSPCFLVLSVEGMHITSKTEWPVALPPADNIFFTEKEISAVICGEISDKQYASLIAAGIAVVRGQAGSAEAAAMFYLNGDLKDNPPGKVCRHAQNGLCSSASCTECHA